MKKLKKKILIAALLFCTMTLGLCSSLSEAKTEEKEETTSNCEVLIDFENIKDTLSCLRFTSFNKGELCSESQYVTEGKSSLHLYTKDKEQGTYSGDVTIVLYPNKSTYLDTEYISLDVYNASENGLNAVFGFADVYETYVVEPGKNTLWLYVDRSRLEYDTKGEIADFYLQFASSKEAELIDIYLDNFSGYLAQSKYSKYSNDFSGEVKYAFEAEAELANILINGSNFQKPILNINHDIRYLKSGMGSLKVEFQSREITSVCLEDDKLGDFNQYLDELKKYKLCVPIYNANDYDITCAMIIHSGYNNETITVQGTIPAGAWAETEFQVSLAELKEQFTGSGLDIKSIEFYFDDIYSGGIVYIDSIGVYAEK